MSGQAMCQATFEPCPDQRDRPGTHTCAGPLRHAGPHECPTCGVFWTRRPTAARGRVVEHAMVVGARALAEAVAGYRASVEKPREP